MLVPCLKRSIKLQQSLDFEAVTLQWLRVIAPDFEQPTQDLGFNSESFGLQSICIVTPFSITSCGPEQSESSKLGKLIERGFREAVEKFTGPRPHGKVNDGATEYF